MRTLLGPLARDLGWDPRDDDDERTPSLRSSVLRTLGHHRRRPRHQRGGQAPVRRGRLHPPAPRYRVGHPGYRGRHGGPAEYEAFLSRYRNPATPQEENRYLYALASFTEPALATRTFDLALSEVRTQNAPFVLQSLVANRVNGPAAWQRLTEEWDSLVAKFPSNILPRMLDGVRGMCSPPELAAQVTGFIEAHPLPAGGRTVEQILERLAVNVAFGEREAGQLAADLGKALELS